ncbi:MAG: glycosyltransferase family 9 protein, partial [Actinobacteria bacterium]|nr:glycosyltransferase family 9 protein [Actinomycetota bacterium]
SMYLDDFIEFPGYPNLPETKFHLRTLETFIQNMQNLKFDLVIQMHGDGSISNSLVKKFHAKITAGYAPKDGKTKTFLPYPYDLPEIQRHLKLLKFLGIPPQGDYLEFPMFDGEEKKFNANKFYWNLNTNYVVVHPGASVEARRWNLEKFAKVSDFLIESGHQVVLTGTESEKDLTEQTVSLMKNTARNLAGQTDLGQLALLIKNARMVISNDTSVSHLAAACKTPSVIISHIKEMERWKPLDGNLHRIIKSGKDDFKMVLEQLTQLSSI